MPGRQRSREELLDEIDDLRAENSDLVEENERLTDRLDRTISVASGDEEEGPDKGEAE